MPFSISLKADAQLGAGTQLSDRTVTVDLSGVTVGTEATLVLRLVNNDLDTASSVRLTSFEVVSGAGSGPVSAAFVGPAAALSSSVDISSLADISGSISPVYRTTSFHDKSSTLHVEAALDNRGTFFSGTPLVLAIDNISDPTVRATGFDGYTPDGLPYYDFTQLVNEPSFRPGQQTDFRSLSFSNPGQVPFAYDAVVLGHLNGPPQITSEANQEALADRPYASRFGLDTD